MRLFCSLIPPGTGMDATRRNIRKSVIPHSNGITIGCVDISNERI